MILKGLESLVAHLRTRAKEITVAQKKRGCPVSVQLGHILCMAKLG